MVTSESQYSIQIDELGKNCFQYGKSKLTRHVRDRGVVNDPLKSIELLKQRLCHRKPNHNFDPQNTNATHTQLIPNTALKPPKMPATKRTRLSSGPASKGAQKTISFNPTKVSKSTSKDSKPTSLHPKAEAEIKVEASIGHVSSEAAVAQQAKTEKENLRSEEEERALAVSDAQVKRYWRECEKARRSARVHQEELGVEEKILRLFDMSSQFGVCSYLSISSERGEGRSAGKERECANGINV